MAQLLVRSLSEDVKEQLRRRAKRYGTSMQFEARLILINALNNSGDCEVGFGTQFRRCCEGVGPNFELPEFPEDDIGPIHFSQ
jgi:hypothetical protein